MIDKKYLIVNGDDFGQSSGVNSGIIHAHEHGILTSASLMVRWPAAAQAADYARESRNLSVGLHLDIGEWRFLDGNWTPLYEVTQLDDLASLQVEVFRQLAAFRDLVGCDPTHIDSHQHVHLRDPLRPVVLEAARELGAPVRACSREVRFCGRFYGQHDDGSAYPSGITVDALIGILAELQPGFTELSCHPGAGLDLETMYAGERMKELSTLCEPRVSSAVAGMGIRLCSFADVRALVAVGVEA